MHDKIETLYRALHLLDYQEMCEALNLTPDTEQSRAIWEKFQHCDRTLREFDLTQLEAIAAYFQKLND